MNTQDQLRESILALAKEIESENFDAYEWVNEQLNIESISRDLSGVFQGAEILVTCGGPDIRVYTRYNTIEGYWGGDSFECRFNDGDRLAESVQEMFDY